MNGPSVPKSVGEKKEKEYTTTYNDTHLWVAKISNEINLPEFHVYKNPERFPKVYTVFLSASTNLLVFMPKPPDPPQKIEFTAPRSYQPPPGKSAWGPLEKWEEFIDNSYPNELKNSTPEPWWCSWGFQKELVVFKKDERHEAVSPVCCKKTHHKYTSWSQWSHHLHLD